MYIDINLNLYTCSRLDRKITYLLALSLDVELIFCCIILSVQSKKTKFNAIFVSLFAVNILLLFKWRTEDHFSAIFYGLGTYISSNCKIDFRAQKSALEARYHFIINVVSPSLLEFYLAIVWACTPFSNSVFLCSSCKANE